MSNPYVSGTGQTFATMWVMDKRLRRSGISGWVARQPPWAAYEINGPYGVDRVTCVRHAQARRREYGITNTSYWLYIARRAMCSLYPLKRFFFVRIPHLAGCGIGVARCARGALRAHSSWLSTGEEVHTPTSSETPPWVLDPTASGPGLLLFEEPRPNPIKTDSSFLLLGSSLRGFPFLGYTFRVGGIFAVLPLFMSLLAPSQLKLQRSPCARRTRHA